MFTWFVVYRFNYVFNSILEFLNTYSYNTYYTYYTYYINVYTCFLNTSLLLSVNANFKYLLPSLFYVKLSTLLTIKYRGFTL